MTCKTCDGERVVLLFTGNGPCPDCAPKCICGDGFGMNLSCPLHSPYPEHRSVTGAGMIVFALLAFLALPFVVIGVIYFLAKCAEWNAPHRRR
jgi:hypothetical protein